MALQNYTPMRLPPTADPILRHELLKVDVFLRQLTSFGARVPTAPQGTPPSSGSFDLLNFLYLPGRAGGQVSRGRVTFETKIISAGGTTTNPAQTGVGFTSYSPTDSPTTANLSMEETASGRTKSPTREWIFPAFNRLNTGPTNGYHYFVDASDYQQLTNKLLDVSTYISIDDTSSLGGLYNSTWDKHLSIGWGGSYPTGGFNSAAGTLTTPVGTQPSLQIPSLDYKVQGAASTRDKSHIWCVMKKDHTAAPFEPNSFLYGGATGKELYHMLASATGLLAAPSQGFIPYYNPTSNLTVTFTLSDQTVEVTTGNTTGLRAGMRVRQTANSYTLPEDTYVESVTDATHFEMTQAWPGSTSTLVTIQVFGPTWENVSAISAGITDVLDSLFRIVDNGDITKKLAFEASGITTATTRTWTIPDFDGTPALFRSNKLRIGDTTAPTHHLEIVAGNTSFAPIRLTSGPLTTAAQSGAIEFETGNFYATNTSGTRGRIMVAISQPLNQRVPFAISSNLTYSHDADFTYDSTNDILNARTFNATRVVYDPLIPLHAITMPTGKALLGTSVDDGYSHVIQADKTIVTDPIGNVVTFFAIMRANPSVDSTSNYLGFDGGVEVKGSANLLTGGAGFGAIGLRGVVENENSATTESASPLNSLYYTKSGHGTTNSVYGMSNRWAHQFGTIVDAYGLLVNCDVRGAGGACTNSYGLFIGDTTQGGTTLNYSLFSYNGPCVFGGNMRVGSTSIPTHRLELVAGTTSIAPLLFTSGTSLTSPAAGAIEFTTDDFFATITTGPARKRLLMADPVGGLTSGRVPFATTNGRLTDDADMTFATDTLTVTKIAAHELTGNLTIADTINLVLNTGTGTKIATGTTQKLGFWNATPIAQPTTAVAAATFVTNTSLIANDSATFDGYTLGQVVKALRNAGILA